jgi:hypothetical protein
MFAPDQVVVRGDGDPSRLFVAFTGWTDDEQTEKFAFRDLCRRLGYRHLLLRDPRRLAYLGGIDDAWDDYERLRDGLAAEIRGAGPENTVFLGESLGGFGALLHGHELGVGIVHAFGPFTTFDLLSCLGDRELMRGAWDFRAELLHIYGHCARHVRRFGLRRVLSRSNGRTRYFVHASRGKPLDRVQALHLAGLPGVDVLLHQGESHLVALHLARQKTLEAWVRSNGRELDFTGARIGDADLPVLAGLRNVSRVHLGDTLATKEGMERLKRSSPSLSVVA